MLVAVAVALVLLEVLWIVAARLALGGGALRSVLNVHPEELEADWQLATSWLPGRLELRGFKIRGQDDQDQWYGEAEHADLAIQLSPLLRKEIVGTRVRLDGVSFRLRPRLDFVKPGSVDPSALPTIPGFQNPPTLAPGTNSNTGTNNGSSPAAPDRRHWRLLLPAIEVTRLHEVWVNELRLAGSGDLRGRLDYTLSGPFETEVTALHLPAAVVGRGRENMATNLDLSLSGTLGPLRFSECHGAQYFRELTARLDLRGTVAISRILSRHLGETESMEFLGQGEIAGDLGVERGKLRTPSHLELRSPKFGVRLGDVVLDGDTSINIHLTNGASGPVSTLTAALKNLDLHQVSTPDITSASGGLNLQAVAYDPTLPDGFKDVAVEVRVGPLELADARVLNRFLPSRHTGEFLHGAFRFSADYTRPRNEPGHGQLQLDGTQLALRIGSRECDGSLALASAFVLPAARRITLGPSAIMVTNLMLSGVKARQADGWHGRVDVERGAVVTGDQGPDQVDLDLSLSLLDTRPLLALLREEEDSPRWLKLMPNLKDLKGGTRLKMAGTNLWIRDLRLRGAATEVMAQLNLADKGPEGILYARYGLISLGLGFRNGESDWTMFGAKRKYRRALADLHLEGAEVPEGEDDGGEPATQPK